MAACRLISLALAVSVLATPSPAQAPAWVVIYAASPPQRDFGIGASREALMSADVEARRRCAGPCPLRRDAPLPCGAVAQGVRDERFFNRWAGPAIETTQPVRTVGLGTGRTQPEAQAEAMRACAERERGVTCQVVGTVCAR
ncbi:MAG: DUF4189 domain-containing protein [Acetobacteraceae bacterium]|nr:DUF4189 domain-containing protein [Acetobacteraceae bacterium]